MITCALADPEGVVGVATPLTFQKRGVASVAVVISTVSLSEQERNGQGSLDVGKSVHVRQAIMQLDAYHVRRGSCRKLQTKWLTMMVNVFFSLIHFWTLLP